MSEKTWDERARAVFAQGCNTYSKRSDQYILGVSPTHVLNQSRAEPCFTGADGKFYYDWVCGLGSSITGCAYNYSLPSTLEVVFAERLQTIFPVLEQMRLFKTGSAACEAAVRVARAYRGPGPVLGVGYHGSSNIFIAAENPGQGCVDEGYHKYPDFQSLIDAIQSDYWEDFEGQPVAVIVEPVQLDLGVRPDLLKIRELCSARDIVLIFDEVVSGLRVPKYCFSNFWEIQPDLLCIGKALGNGHPLAVMGGRRDIMETPGYFLSNTHNGESCAIETAMRTLDAITPEVLIRMWGDGSNILSEINQINPIIQLKGYATRAEWAGSEEHRALFIQEMHKRSHFVGKAWFFNAHHTPVSVTDFFHNAKETIEGIAEGKFTLEGPLPQPVFKRN